MCLQLVMSFTYMPPKLNETNWDYIILQKICVFCDFQLISISGQPQTSIFSELQSQSPNDSTHTYNLKDIILYTFCRLNFDCER